MTAEKSLTDTFTATVWIGRRVGYSDEIIPASTVYQALQNYIDEVGLCVSVTETMFVYVKGNEPGFAIGLINYPRFPATPSDIYYKAKDIARILLRVCKQQRCTVVTPSWTEMFSAEEQQ